MIVIIARSTSFQSDGYWTVIPCVGLTYGVRLLFCSSERVVVPFCKLLLVLDDGLNARTDDNGIISGRFHQLMYYNIHGLTFWLPHHTLFSNYDNTCSLNTSAWGNSALSPVLNASTPSTTTTPPLGMICIGTCWPP